MAWLFICLSICPLFLLLHSPVVLGKGRQNISQSAEYRLREDLFNQYKRMVRPVLQPSDVINVTFQVDFNGLSEVDNRAQVVTTDTSITQIWTNPFLQWDAADYGGIKQILVDPKEIWVPDIVLENNADNNVVQAGYLEKFRSFVIVRDNGENTWMSPASFKSTCDLDVEFFPFDKQKCSMVFRSLTADRSLMDVNTKSIESDDPFEELKLTTRNGYWTLRSIAIKTKDDDHGQNFREVVVSFFIGRRPTYFVLFSFVPCMIIGMLILVSFLIPAESGERIGLCSTILLAVSVYLLVVTEQLPEQSDTLPLIGVYYIVIMFEIGLALAATVLVLMAYHGTSEPPKFLTYITVVNKFDCCNKKKRRKEIISSPTNDTDGAENSGNEAYDVELGVVKKKKPAKAGKGNKFLNGITTCYRGMRRQTSARSTSEKATAGEENAGRTTETDKNEARDVELGEVNENEVELVAMEKKHRPSSAFAVITDEEEDAKNQETWKEIAYALDRIFFWLFVALFGLSTFVIYAQAGRLQTADKF